MNKIKSLIRIAVLFTLGIVAIALLFGEEQTTDNANWFIHFVFDKSLSFGLIYCCVRLYKRWSKVDPWLMAYDEMCDEAMKKPNPIRHNNK